jgi:hypothetical protein
MGLTIQQQIKRLADPPRGKGRAGEIPDRDAIPAAKSEAVPDTEAISNGTGIASPLTEQAYSGSAYYQLVSSDGLFVLEFPVQTRYLDADSKELIVDHTAP